MSIVKNVLPWNPNGSSLIIYKLPSTTSDMYKKKQEEAHLKQHQMDFETFRSVAMRYKFLQS